jgi:hypothetical protein
MFYAIGFLRNDPRSRDDWFLDEGARIISGVAQVLERQAGHPPVEVAVVRALVSAVSPDPDHAKDSIWVTEQGIRRYADYETIYFVNDAALRMYRDAGHELEVLHAVEGLGEMGLGGSGLTGPYCRREAPAIGVAVRVTPSPTRNVLAAQATPEPPDSDDPS